MILDTFRYVLTADSGLTFLEEISLGFETETFFIEMTENLQSMIYVVCAHVRSYLSKLVKTIQIKKYFKSVITFPS